MSLRITLFLALFAQVVFSQSLPVGNLLSAPSADLFSKNTGPKPNQQPPVFFGPLTDLLDHTFDSLMNLTDYKGYSAAIQLPDGSVWKRAAGLAGAPAQPLTTSHLIGMGSMTKAFVSTALLLLQEDGLLDLDDSIGTWIAPHPNIKGSITVRQLLNHTSGLYNYTNSTAWNDALSSDLGKMWAPEEMLGYVQAPYFTPGANWKYSNTNYILAGLIVEEVTGQPLHTVLRERILTPLGMMHTFLYPQETPADDIAHLWIDLVGDAAPEDLQAYGLPLTGIFSSAWAAGALLTTPEDLSIFQKQLFNGEILTPASMAEMQTSVPFGAAGGYGLGVLPVPFCGGEGWGHDGNIFYQSAGFYFPSLQMGIVVQTNDSRQEANLKINPVDLLNTLATAYCDYQTTAANEPHGILGIQVSPNPAGEEMTIHLASTSQLPQDLRWELYNALGQSVRSGVWMDDARIPMGDLPAGLFTLKVFGSGRVRGVKQVVKE